MVPQSIDEWKIIYDNNNTLYSIGNDSDNTVIDNTSLVMSKLGDDVVPAVYEQLDNEIM